MMSQTLLWVTDPWNTLAHSQDTTLRLIQEAANLGTRSYWSGSDVLLDSSNPNRFHAVTAEDVLRYSPDESSMKLIELEPSKIHQIHYRVDPPVDFNYLGLLDKISRCVGHEDTIYSPPSVLREQSEKIPPSKLRHLAPLMMEVRDAAAARSAHELFKDHDQVVSKPLNEAQSKGVKLWNLKNPRVDSLESWLKIFSTETQNFASPIVIQEYLPDVHRGETRMWFAGGAFVAALKKFPKSGDFRVLIDEGSRIEAYTLAPGEMKIAEEVGAILREQRVAMAAIDFISGKISDYNITSPGLLVQLEKVHGRNFAAEVLRRIL